MRKIKKWLGLYFYFVPDLWIFKKIKGLPIINTSIEEAQNIITEALQRPFPTLVARVGGNELDFSYYFGLRNQKLNKNLVRELKVAAGVFDIEEDLAKESLKEAYLEAIKNIDILVAWRKEEKYFDINYLKKIALSDLEVFRSQNPFTRNLQGKILIVSPFVQSIESQILRARNTKTGTVYRLFDLGKVEFVFFKPLQTHGSAIEYGFNSWVDALDYQKQKIEELDFDIALLSCGAYGLPIGSFIKNHLEKKAVVVGGVLQLYFDIIGRRWENNYRVLNALDSGSVIRPSAVEIPTNASEIELSSYY